MRYLFAALALAVLFLAPGCAGKQKKEEAAPPPAAEETTAPAAEEAPAAKPAPL